MAPCIQQTVRRRCEQQQFVSEMLVQTDESLDWIWMCPGCRWTSVWRMHSKNHEDHDHDHDQALWCNSTVTAALSSSGYSSSMLILQSHKGCCGGGGVLQMWSPPTMRIISGTALNQINLIMIGPFDKRPPLLCDVPLLSSRRDDSHIRGEGKYCVTKLLQIKYWLNTAILNLMHPQPSIPNSAKWDTHSETSHLIKLEEADLHLLLSVLPRCNCCCQNTSPPVVGGECDRQWISGYCDSTVTAAGYTLLGYNLLGYNLLVDQQVIWQTCIRDGGDYGKSVWHMFTCLLANTRVTREERNFLFYNTV